MSKYLLSCGEEYGTEYPISIYDTVDDAKQAAVKHLFKGYEMIKKCVRSENSKAKCDLTINWEGGPVDFSAKTKYMQYKISLVKYNVQEF